jgi:hypothetical protein
LVSLYNDKEQWEAFKELVGGLFIGAADLIAQLFLCS